jgi:hypothetical protein
MKPTRDWSKNAPRGDDEMLKGTGPTSGYPVVVGIRTTMLQEFTLNFQRSAGQVYRLDAAPVYRAPHWRDGGSDSLVYSPYDSATDLPDGRAARNPVNLPCEKYSCFQKF